MSLQQALMRLDKQTLRQINEDIVNMSLAISTGGQYRETLAKRRRESRGKVKDIYAALYKAKPYEIQRMADNVVDVSEVLRGL